MKIKSKSIEYRTSAAGEGSPPHSKKSTIYACGTIAKTIKFIDHSIRIVIYATN
jgi:hypothetical protein